MDDQPTLILRRRTPSEHQAWKDGARLALTMVLGRLPATTAYPTTGTIPAAEVMAVVREVADLIAAEPA